MNIQPPPESAAILRRLLNGYQFSRSDCDAGDELARMYDILNEHFGWFRAYFEAQGLRLLRDGDESVILLEKDDTRVLSKEERQALVALFLLADLWLEQQHSYRDLFTLPVPWRKLAWFRDGYGREYLEQVEITEIDELESVWKRLDARGIVTYRPDTMTVTLREPANRIITLARHIHHTVRAQMEERHARDE